MSNNALVFATYLADILGLTISANGVCLISKNKDQELSFKLTFRSEMANNKEITGMNRCDSLQQSAYIVKVLFCLYTMPIGYLYFWVTRKSACKRCFLCQITYRKEFMLSLMMSTEAFEFVGEYSFHFILEGLIQFKACLHCFWDFKCTFEGRRTRYLSNLTLTSKGRRLFLPWIIWSSAIKECRILAHLFQSSTFLKAAGKACKIAKFAFANVQIVLLYSFRVNEGWMRMMLQRVVISE